MNWNQPICGNCWNARNPGRVPVQGWFDGIEERCAYCGHPTTAAIFVRDDPATVPYPAEEPNP